MKEIIAKYFSDPASEENYVSKNEFYPSANPDKIISVEKSFAIEFPQDYKEFLSITNGFEGMIGQSYVRFNKVAEMEEYTKAYCVEFFPWLIHIGSNGGDEMFVLDKRESTLRYGIMPYIGDDEDFIPLGNTFEEFVGHLYNNDFWER
jgi:hypothetical protein